MAQLLVRNLDDRLKTKLQLRAESHGRSMEEEAHDILCSALLPEPPSSEGLGTQIAALFKEIGLRDGEEIREMRGYPVRPAMFDE